MAYTRLSAAEAAAMINDQDTIGLSGFTPNGVPKATFRELSKRAVAEHEAGRAFQVGILTGASTSQSIGKTGLIHHVFENISKQEPETHCFYLDINTTRNLSQFIQLLAKTVIGKVDTFSQTAMRKITTFFAGYKPTMSFDEMTGIPTFSITVSPSQREDSLKHIFEYLKQSEKRIYIAIDEFQQIAEYPEDGTEALLRSYIQFLPNVYFIFAGSKQVILIKFRTDNVFFSQIVL